MGKLDTALGGAATGAAIGSAGGPLGIGIGAGIGGLAGLFGGSDDPEFHTAAIDPGYGVHRDALAARGAMSQEDFAKEANEGIGAESSPFAAHGGGQGGFLSDALQNRATNKYNASISRTERQGGIDAYERKRQAQRDIYGIDKQKSMVDLEMAAKQKMFQLESDKARNQVLSSVLGNAGNAIGTMIAKNSAPQHSSGSNSYSGLGGSTGANSFFQQSSYQGSGALYGGNE